MLQDHPLSIVCISCQLCTVHRYSTEVAWRPTFANHCARGSRHLARAGRVTKHAAHGKPAIQLGNRGVHLRPASGGEQDRVALLFCTRRGHSRRAGSGGGGTDAWTSVRKPSGAFGAIARRVHPSGVLRRRVGSKRPHELLVVRPSSSSQGPRFDARAHWPLNHCGGVAARFE